MTCGHCDRHIKKTEPAKICPLRGQPGHTHAVCVECLERMTAGAPAETPAGRPLTEAERDASNCTCHHTCEQDSHSGDWHQHEDDPCPVHPSAPIVG